MARRQLMSAQDWQVRLDPATGEREIIRHYTLDEDDLDVIMRKRRDVNRLGFALTVCLMRHPDRAMEQGEVIPLPIVQYVARQLAFTPDVFDNDASRDRERRKQLAQAMRQFGFLGFDRAALRDLIAWLTPAAQVNRKPGPLIDRLIAELRRRKMLLPSPRVLELVVVQARLRGERILHEALTGPLTDDQRSALDALLSLRAQTPMTHLAWLQTGSRSPAARNITGMIERLDVVRGLGLDHRLAERVPSQVFERLAAEGRRMSAQHIGDLARDRRHAVLLATLIALETELTDASLFARQSPCFALVRQAGGVVGLRVSNAVKRRRRATLAKPAGTKHSAAR